MKPLATYSNFVDLIGDRAQNTPDKTAFIFLKNGEEAEVSLTFAALDQRARAIATVLQTKAKMGDRALLVYPYEAGLEFITVFLGCLYAGIVAIPTHPPRNQHSVEDVRGRMVSSSATLILTPQAMQATLHRKLAGLDAQDQAQDNDSIPSSSYHWLATDKIPSNAADWQRPDLPGDTLAFLQYTSGSTGLPKGVMVSHASLMQNQQLLSLAFGHTEQLVGVGWLPLFHDMGLIGNVLQSLYMGTPCVLMSPIAFVQKPVRWVQAISHYRATTSGGPNFAYDLLCRYVTEAQVAELDLSHWDVAFSGAEPVRSATMQQFSTKFGPCGFRPEAFYPCYGMAEATLLITGGQKSNAPRTGYVEEAALAENRVVWSDRPIPGSRAIVGCGQPWLDGAIAIVNPHTQQRCAPDEIGEIWVSGSGLGQGYWNEPEKTKQTFQAYTADSQEGPFMRTGDLGFLRHGELFITGRLNDVLVFWGLNHYPEQLEQTVATCHPAFRANHTAAFAISVEGRDRLVIAQEVERQYRHQLNAAEVVETVRWILFDQHFVDVYALVLLKPGRLPKTSSGKVQRRICRDRYLNGELEILDEWRSPSTVVTDIPAIIRRYLNPMTHLRRWGQRYGSQLRNSLLRNQSKQIESD